MAVSTTKNTKTKPPAEAAEVEDGKSSTTELMAADAVVGDVEFPEGCPELRAPHEMSRRERIPYMKMLAEVGRLQKNRPVTAEGDEEVPTEIKLEQAVSVSELVSAIEDLLATTAPDEEAFRTWAFGVDDAVLVQAFNAYMKRKQPGEAQSSAG